MDFCRIAVFFDYVRYPWAHQVHCFLMLDGRRLVCLMGYNVLTGRQSVSTWHGAWWAVRADHNLPGQNLLVVAMNWRGVPPLREHIVFWHAAQFYLYDLAWQVPQLREVDAHGHGLWPGFWQINGTGWRNPRRLYLDDIVIIDDDWQWEVERDNDDGVMWF